MRYYKEYITSYDNSHLLVFKYFKILNTPFPKYNDKALFVCIDYSDIVENSFLFFVVDE